MIRAAFGIFLLCGSVCPASADSVTTSSQVAQKSVVEKRQAVRVWADEKNTTALAAALNDDDPLVRRNAFKALCQLDAAHIMVYAKPLFQDSSPLVRHAVVQEISGLVPDTDEMRGLLIQARHDVSPMVAKAANKTSWPFQRTNIPMRQRLDVDHEVEVMQTIDLPRDGWKFLQDRTETKHQENCYEINYDDSSWADIVIEKAWDECGYKEYIGVGWYRKTFELPVPPADYKAVELHFASVDENAWVWLNGVYIGQHAIGAAGWDLPFNLDVTQEVQWNRKNQLTVRVLNSALCGGIWKPIQLEVINIK